MQQNSMGISSQEIFELRASQGCPRCDRRLWPDPNADNPPDVPCTGPHPIVVAWDTAQNTDRDYERWRVRWCTTHRKAWTPIGLREGTHKHLWFALLHGYKIIGGN